MAHRRSTSIESLRSLISDSELTHALLLSFSTHRRCTTSPLPKPLPFTPLACPREIPRRSDVRRPILLLNHTQMA